MLLYNTSENIPQCLFGRCPMESISCISLIFLVMFCTYLVLTTLYLYFAYKTFLHRPLMISARTKLVKNVLSLTRRLTVCVPGNVSSTFWFSLPCQYPRKCAFDDISEIARASLMKNNQNFDLLTTNGCFRGKKSTEILLIYTLDINTLSQAGKEWKIVIFKGSVKGCSL